MSPDQYTQGNIVSQEGRSFLVSHNVLLGAAVKIHSLFPVCVDPAESVDQHDIAEHSTALCVSTLSRHQW